MMHSIPDHIPKHKHSELEIIISIITQAAKKTAPIEMIILFGSYARGDFVEQDIVQEGHTTLEYKSDFDLLLITRNPNPEHIMRASREINLAIANTPGLNTPVSIILEDIGHINARLEEGRYFYLDIKKEGIMLYDSGKLTLAQTNIPTPQEKQAMKEEDFKSRYGSSLSFFLGYKDFFTRGDHNGAAFILHQTAEKAITSYMLVKTRYKPKTHDLGVLYEQLKGLEQSFDQRFNLKDPEQLHHFKLLRKAYVDARYSSTYRISPEELEYIANKIENLHSLVEKFCQKELQQK